MVESLESRLLLSGTHQQQLLNAVDSALQSSNLSGLGAWTSKLNDASAMGRSLPLIGSELSNLQLNSGLILQSTEASLSALVTDLQHAGNNAVVSATRDLPDDIEIDFQHTTTASTSGAINAAFGLPITLPGTIDASVSFTESLTLGAYWDNTTSSPVFYVNTSNSQLKATVTATAHVNGTGGSLGFVTLGINGATANLNAAFSMSLNAQPPVDASEPAGRLTLDQLNNTPLSSLVSTQLSSSAPTTLALQIHTPLSSSATNISFSWPDITDPTNVTSSLSSDPTLAQLSKLQDISADSFSSGIDMATGALESLATTSLSNLGIFQKKLPLLNESIASAVNFQQFFSGNFSSLTDQVPNASGILTSPFQNSDQLLNLLKTIPNSTVSDVASGNQITYSLSFDKTISTSVPLSLNLGSALNLNVTSTLNFSCDVAVHLQFGVDGSTGTFFIVANGQPAVTLTPTLTATLNGSASLGFLSINITNGTVTGTGTGSITLNDPQTDSPATPGIITASELASANFSALLSPSFTGSVSASLPLSSTVPGINPATLTLSFPDLTDPSNFTFNSGALTQFMGFNGLSFQTVLGYLENLPTMLQNLAGPKALGGSLAFLGSSVGQAVTLGNDLNTKVIQPLQSLNINTVQDLQTQLAAKLAQISSTSILGLNVSSSDIDFSFDFKPSYSTSASWSLSKSIGPSGLLSFQTSGTAPLSASLDAKLEFGISLSDLSNPTDAFYLIEGPSSQITGSFSAAVNNITATATVGYLATVGISNGTASVNGSLTLPLGSGSAGTHLTLTNLLADPTSLFGTPAFTGTANVHLPLSGLPGQTTNPLPYIGLSWPDITNITNVTPDVSTINFNNLNPLANFDASSVLSSIDSLLDLIQQWGSSSIMKTNIPLINEPISSVLDYVGEAQKIFTQIQQINATTPSAFDAAVEAAPQAAGFLSSQVGLIAGSLDNPAQQTFDYVLQFHHTVNDSIPFSFGPGFFTVNGNVNVAATFTTNLEFGYDPANGFYIVGDPAHPAISLSANITGTFNRIGGMFGPISYGISNGTASANVALSLDLAPPGSSGVTKISGSQLIANTAQILQPSITGSANLNLPIGFTLGANGPGATTTFSASWDPSRAQPFEFGPTNSTDITDGFSSVDFDLGEFVNSIIGPVLSDIEQDNPIPQSVLDTLNATIPVIDMTPAQLLGDYLNNPGFKLLLGIDSAISDMPGSGAESVDLSNYFTAGTMPSGPGYDSGGPQGGVPPAGNPTGTPSSGNFSAFKSFQQTLENDFYLKLPILDNPATSIINILTGKAVTLVEFDPGKVSVSASYQTPKISFPLLDFGFADVSATLQANVSASLFADIDIELTTRGLEGTYISGGKLVTGQSANLLDGLAINDSDQYQAGLSLSGGVTIGGSVDILGFSAASLSGSLTLTGILGAHINDLSYNHDNTIQGPANFEGDGAGDNEVYADELEYLVNNYGLPCAIMPAGELDATVSLSVSALGGLFSKQLASGTVTLANFNGPCAPTLADLASIQGTSLVMHTNTSTTGLDVSASIVENTTTGQPQYLKITTNNDNTNDYELFALSDLTTAGVTTLVLQGTNGDDEFFIDPTVTKAGGMHLLQFITGNGNDRVNLASLTAANSTITGETITAGNGNDNITGNYAPEVITLGSGQNQVSTGTGNDSVTATSGTDTITGSNGNETVVAGSGADLIGLGDGNNVVTAGAGTATITVGNGKNLINAGSGAETIFTGDGDNKIYADSGGSNITVGAGQNIIYATNGNATVKGGGGNDFIYVGGGNNTIDGGTGSTLLAVVADANQTLSNTQVIVGSGTTKFSNIATISLTGGASANTFDVSAWTGNPVQINGGGGSDTLVSKDNTDFTLTDTSLARSDGAKFALNGIANVNLIGGGADASFDVTGWHGGGTLTGGAGVNTLVASNLTTATLTNSTLQRSGATNLSFSGIIQASLTAGLLGGAHIDASAFTGTIALFGQGSNNTLVGGSGSDYIVGGSGSGNVLTGNGTQDNQIIGGTGSSDSLTGGSGNNVLVGSSGGHDTITSALGASHVYTPGGNDTINVQTGKAIVYVSGTGNTVNTGSSTTDQVLHPGDSGTVTSDFTAPTPYIGAFAQAPSAPAATLPTNSATTGQWVELGGSASSGGLSSSTGAAFEPSIVATGTGSNSAEIVAWADNRNGVYEIYVARYASGAWQQLAGSAQGEGISNSTVDSRRPSITLDASGNPIVAWTEVNGSSTNIFAAKYDPTANSGAGGWVALGTSLSASGLSSTGHADNAQIVNTSAGPVVAWLDSTSGHASVYVRQFTGTTWAALGSGADSGTGVSASSTNIPGFSLTNNGTTEAIAWTQPGTSAGSSIYLKQNSGSGWAAINNSASTTGISGANSASMPSIAYQSGVLFAAWAAVSGGTTNIAAVTNTGSAWAPVSIDTPQSAGPGQISRGAASHPVLSSNGTSLELAWVEDRLVGTSNQAVAIYADQLTGGAFVRQLAGDASFDGILHRSTSLSGPAALALAVDGSGHPFVAWGDSSSGSSQVYVLGNTLNVQKIIYVNDGLSATDSYTTASGAPTNTGLTPSSPLDSISAALNLASGPGTVILVDSGTLAGFTLGSAANGVLILGSPGAPTVISGAATLNSASNVTLEGLQLAGGLTVSGGSNIELLGNTGGTPSQVASGHAAGITIQGASNVTVQHDVIDGLTLSGTSSGIRIQNNTIGGAGISVTGSNTALFIGGNQLQGLSLSAVSSGTITGNNISNLAGTDVNISAAFTGSIDHNLIHNATIGVTMTAAAPLNANIISNNTTGIVDPVSGASALGFMVGALPNKIIANGTGVNLSGQMQGQQIISNVVGVSGSGVLGGTSLDSANLIQGNSVGVSFVGTVQYNRINRNGQAILVQSGQLIAHNLFANNVGPNIETAGATGVQIIDNTLISNGANNVLIDGGSSNVQVLNNIMSASAGYDLNVADDSRSGFFSDYNDLFAAGLAKIVHYLVDFTDILDWQDALNEFDLHSIGATSVNPTGAQPQFVDASLGDLRVFPAAAGLRQTSPTIATGDPAMDVGLPGSYQNLLSNPSFESGVSGWTVNVGGATASTNPTAFDGSNYFYSGAVASGFAQQTISLTGIANKDLMFGGRIRSAAETPADQGELILTFLDSSNNPIGSPITLSASNVNDRWELISSRVHIPANATSVTYRFQNVRQSGSTDDSYLDNAFVYVLPNTLATDMGAYGNTPASVSATTDQSIHLESPDLYTNWTLNQPHQIVWATTGNTGNGPVNIDLYHLVGGVPTLVTHIASSAADTGSLTWTPANSGLSGNLSGLWIQISLASNIAISDRGSETFSIVSPGISFYINDGAVVAGDITTAVGSNRNTGTSPGSPLPMLTTLLREYALNSSDTIFIDNGSYNTFAPAVFSSLSSLGTGAGTTVHGPTAAGTSATITALGYTNDGVIDVNDANNVTLTNLSLVGGAYGIWALGGSLGLTLSSISATAGAAGGIRIESNSTGAALDHITVNANSGNGIFIGGGGTTLNTITANNNAGDGIYVGGNFTSLTHAIADNNANDGIDLVNSGNAVVTSSEASGNQTGLYVSNSGGGQTIIGNSNLSAGQGNIFHNNALFGINAAFGSEAIYGNTVYGQSTGNGNNSGIGIQLDGNNPCSENVIWNNVAGMSALEVATPISNNRIFDNSLYGIVEEAVSAIVGNDIYSNGIGILVNSASSETLQNNLIYANGSAGISINGSNAISILNNTIYQTTGDVLRMTQNSSGISVRNNILWDAASGGYDINIDGTSEAGFSSDYNLFDTSGSAVLGNWGGTSKSTLSGFRALTGTDADSLVAAPLFVNMTGADGVLGFAGGVDHGLDDDFHDKSTTGSFHGGSLAPDASTGLPVLPTATLTADATESPTIDRGDPAAAFSLEPAPNGGAINIGAFGDTAQASESAAPYVILVAPNGGESVLAGQSYVIKWRSDSNSGTVNIDLLQGSSPAGAMFVSHIVAAAANSGTYTWAVPSNISPASNYYIRITSTSSSSVTAESAAAFTIKSPMTTFYINDGTVVSGDYTTQPGDDSNDGLSPSTPMASIAALLQTYTLGTGDLVLVDNGTYNIAGNIILTAANSGLTIQGFTGSGGSTVINRQSTAGGSYVFNIQGATNVTLDHLSITGAQIGVVVGDNAGSTGLKITNDQIYSNLDDGIYLGIGNNGAMITGNQVYGQYNQSSSDAGILINGAQATVSNNQAHDNYWAGIYANNGSGSTISSNITYNNTYGIEANNASVSGNISYSNTAAGILGTGTTTVTGNTAHDNTTGFFGEHVGIELDTGASGSGNVVYNNTNGIYVVGNGVIASNNLAYGNTTAGIEVNGSSDTASGNVTYSNGWGIQASTATTTTLNNNLIYNNSTGGIDIQSGQLSPVIINNTIYQPAGDGIRVESYATNSGGTPLFIRDNIIWVQNGFDLNLDSTVGPALTSDYNDLYATGSGQIGKWQNVSQSTLAAWQSATFNDADSISADPLFVNVAGADFHVQSVNGSYHGGSLAPVLNTTTGLPMTVQTPTPSNDAANSPTIDRGAPGDAFNLEPTPNGSFVNLGSYGDTNQSSISPSAYVTVIHPNGGDNWATRQTFNILWHDNQIGLGGTQTVTIDLLQGSTVTNLVTGLTDTGVYAWMIPSTVASGANYKIRITETGSSSLSDTSDNTFSIVQAAGIYYVNDGTVSSGDITTAPGNDANSGLTPSSPKASIQAILNSYTLNPGDTINVDTGTYNVSSNILLTAADNGIIIKGPGAGSTSRYTAAIQADSPIAYYPMNETSGTVATDASGHGANATYVGAPSLGQSVLFGPPSNAAVGFNGSTQSVHLPNGFANIAGGFTFETWVNPAATNAQENIFDLGNGTNNEIYLLKGVFTNNLIIGGSYGSFTISGALAYGSWQQLAVTISGGTVTVYRNGTPIGGGTITAPDNITRTTNNLAAGASFTDFAGQMQETAFYSTALTPTQIANHYSAAGAAILNRGSTNQGSEVFQLDGGSNITIENLTITGGVDAVEYTSGTNSVNDTITNCVIYGNSGNGIDIFGFTNTADNFTLTNSIIASNGGSGFSDVNSNTPLVTGNTFFANGGSGINIFSNGGTFTNNQVIANGANGITSGTNNISIPMTISGNTVTANNNSGINNGDPNALITGNIISGQTNSGQTGIFGNGLDQNNTVFGNYIGIQANGGTHSGNRVFDNLTIGILFSNGSVVTGNDIYSNGTWGIQGGNNGGATTISNNLIYANVLGGFDTTVGNLLTLLNNTIYQPTGTGITVTNNAVASTGAPFTFRDNIIEVGAGPAYSIDDFSFPGFIADYNDIFVTGTGSIASVAGHTINTGIAWATESGQDTDSIFVDPKFVNPAGADGVVGFSGGVDHGADDNFNVQSGSPTIDAADPSLPVSNEPSPNGGRANLGYTGGTAQATLSPTQSIQVISPNSSNIRVQPGQTLPITWNTDGLSIPGLNNTYSSTILSQSPLTYLKLDETTGTTAVDSSGNSLNGVYVNGPALGQPSVFGAGNGQSVAFDGGTDTVTVSSSALDLKRTVTMSAWIKPSTLAPTWQPIFYKGAGDFHHRTYSVFLNTAGFLLLSSWDGSAERDLVTPNGAIQANVWTHIAVVMDRNTGTASIYINGKLSAQAAPGVFPTVDAADSISQPLYIGYSPEDPSFRYTGAIDEAAVFGSALSATAISAQYAADRGTVHIDLTNAAGTTLQSIATGVANQGSYSWSIPSNLTPGQYKIRVTSDLNGILTDLSDNPFLVLPTGNSYYVNGSSTGGVFTTAGGNDANDGKSPSTPMSSIQAVLNADHPGPGSTIYVDTGTYNLLGNIILTAADSGITFEGVPAQTTILNRGNGNVGEFVFDLQNVNNVTFDHLAITGAYAGINGGFNESSSNITVSNDLIYSNAGYGIFTNNQTGWVVTGNSIHDTGSGGVGINFFNNNSNTFTGNTVFNNPSYGIFVQTTPGSVSVISGNTVFSNNIGISAAANNATTTVSNNTVFSNAQYGLDIESGAAAINNTVFKQTNTNAAGIFILNFAEIRGNTVYDNFNGISISQGNALIDRNKIYSNTSAGINVINSGIPQIIENLIYANSGPGINLNGLFNNGLSIIGNTIYETTADAVKFVSAPGVTLRNNILWTQNGYDLDLTDTASQTNFASDYNDLFVTGSAHIVFFNGAAQPSLVAWKGVASDDTHSVSADPKFVDIDGADNVLGYTTAGSGANDGTDDDFYLAAGSPAIDDGQSLIGYTTDIEGTPRTDDPGTPNTGTPDYVVTDTGSSQFTAGGTFQNFNPSGLATTSRTIPFAFPFYGSTYTNVVISSTGNIRLGAGIFPEPGQTTANSLGTLAGYAMIAPLWGNISMNASGNDLFIDTSVTNQMTIRWVATNAANGTPLNFQVTLFSDGRIRFDYGSGNTGMVNPTIGIGMGDGQHYLLAPNNGNSNFTNSDSILFNTAPGYVDMGAYEFHGNSNVTTPPTLTATTPTAISAGSSTGPLSQIGLTFSAPLNSIDALAPSDFQLVGAGPDGTFGTSDDVTYALSPQYTVGSTQDTLNITAGALPNGTYRLTVLSNVTGGVHDVNGLLLDGDANGSAGGNYVRTFTVAVTTPPALTSSVYSSSASTVQFVFSKNITLSSPSNLTVTNLVTNTPVTPTGVTVSGNTITISLPTLGDGLFSISLPAASVQDLTGDPLASGITFAFLQVAGGHTLVLPATTTNYTLQYLSIGAGATLDIKDDTLTYVGGTPGAWNGSAYTGLLGLLHSGRNGGAWNGHGIISSSAVPARVSPAVALVTQGNNVILRQTYAGDVNLDGVINGDDYFILDSQYALMKTGDLNGDGRVDADDYFIIDRNYARHAAAGHASGDLDNNGVINGDDYFLMDNSYAAYKAIGYAAGDFNYDGRIDADDYFLIDANYNKAQSALSNSQAITQDYVSPANNSPFADVSLSPDDAITSDVNHATSLSSESVITDSSYAPPGGKTSVFADNGASAYSHLIADDAAASDLL